jgi:hypothetical protein
MVSNDTAGLGAPVQAGMSTAAARAAQTSHAPDQRGQPEELEEADLCKLWDKFLDTSDKLCVSHRVLLPCRVWLLMLLTGFGAWPVRVGKYRKGIREWLMHVELSRLKETYSKAHDGEVVPPEELSEPAVVLLVVQPTDNIATATGYVGVWDGLQFCPWAALQLLHVAGSSQLWLGQEPEWPAARVGVAHAVASCCYEQDPEAF